ncbi:cytochrome P450, partial [Streptomyces clavuligerus]
MNPSTALRRSTRATGRRIGTAPGAGSVPERTRLPLFGHALSVPAGGFTEHTLREARALGPLFNLRFFDTDCWMVSGPELVAELCDETRFRKSVQPIAAVREFAGDGLFTAFGDEPNWRKAHNILMPAFSYNALRAYHPTMVTVARRVLDAWDRNAGTPVDVPEDMTRLTLDTIGLCGFGHDFECFERTTPHPFITAMVSALDHAQRKDTFIPGLDFLRRGAEARQRINIETMNRLADDIVRRRRAASDGGADSADDLLGLMLHAEDKDTGQPLDDMNIRYQMLTFLIAGHETTSGALSFALYYLLKNPSVLAAARAETDALWGTDPDPDPTYEDIGRLHYLRQVLNESLRLWPTAPAFAVEPLEDTVIGGRYPVHKGQPLTVLTPVLHRDPAWGDNPELFDPARFDPEQADSRPGHLYKPFGNGERSCIGRQFALHEATLMLGLIVHRYRLIDHADYELKIKETLTIKPDGFTLVPVRREESERRRAATVSRETAERAGAMGPSGTTGGPGATGTAVPAGLRAPGTTLTVLHGSNLGTSRTLAADLADQGARHGFRTSLAPLDDAVGALAPGQPVLIVASSYNGRPTDDACRFVEWLESGAAPADVPYAVLGIGDRNWAATYQRVPTLIDEQLTAAGSTPLVERAAVDVSADVATEVERWSGRVWGALLDRYGVPVDPAEAADAERPAVPTGPRHTVTDTDAAPGLPVPDGLVPLTVVETGELADLDHPLGRSKRFLRLDLAHGMEYRTADHLLVRPANPAALVDRTAAVLGLDPERTVVLGAAPGATGRGPSLPTGEPMTVRTLLTHLVELGRPATARQARALAAHAPCPPERATLERHADGPTDGPTAATATVTDLLERNASCRPGLADLLDILVPMNLRYYSVSSSPALAPGSADLMVAA